MWTGQFLAIPRKAGAVRDSLTPTVLSAGSSINVIPQTASAELDCRLLPKEDPNQFLMTLRKVINDDSVKLETRLTSRSSSSPNHSELMKSIEAFARAHGKARVVPTMISGFTDSRFFRYQDVISYGFIPVEVASAEEHGVHGIDERISVAELRSGIQNMVECLRIVGEESHRRLGAGVECW